MARDSSPRGSKRVDAGGPASGTTTPGRASGTTTPGRASGTTRGAGRPARGRASGAGPGRFARLRDREARAERRAARRQRFSSVRTAFTMTRQVDPRLVPYLAIALLVPFVLLLSLGLLLGYPLLLGFVGLMIALVAATAVFGRRVQQAAYSTVEGQVGAAASVLNSMRGDWRVTPAVGFSRDQDLVHRVVGRPGVVLVGEGSPSRARGLLVTEKKKLARFLGDTPVYDVVVGDGEGQVPLRQLEKHFGRLPRNLTPKDVNALDRRLKAVAPALPIPKGPVPTSGRIPRGKIR